MAYTVRHKLLTAFGSAFGGNEEWSFGIRISPPAGSLTVSQAQSDACWTLVSAMFDNDNMFIPRSYTLQGVKVAPIGTDGKYPVGEIAYQTLGNVNNSVTPNVHAPQIAMAVTTMSDLPRGRLSHGRFYLPAPQASIDEATGQIAQVIPNGQLATLKTMFNALSAVPDLGTPAIFSKIDGVGFRAITRLKIGRILDTQRRRRNHLNEAYTVLAL